MKQIIDVTVGCDPEVFLINKETNKHVSAIGLFPGDKEMPYMIDKEGHGVLIDNCSVEFVIVPAKTKEEFSSSVKKCLSYIEDNCPKELSISRECDINFDQDQLEAEGACVVGCSSDFNVYSGKMNTPPNVTKTRQRVSAGHVHIGWKSPNNAQREAVVKAMDLFVTLPMVLMEKANTRRKMYGKAGDFRPKPYGVESRSPSNHWIFTEETSKWVFEQTHKAIEWLNKGNEMDLGTELNVTKAINTYDQELAVEMCDKFGILVPETMLINK